jgi:hypothetical protein
VKALKGWVDDVKKKRGKKVYGNMMKLTEICPGREALWTLLLLFLPRDAAETFLAVDAVDGGEQPRRGSNCYVEPIDLSLSFTAVREFLPRGPFYKETKISPSIAERGR